MPWPDPIVAPTARVRGSQLARYTCVGEESVLEESVLGDYSYVMERCFLQNAHLGRFVSVAAHVCLGAPEHPLDRPSTHHFTYRSAQYGLGEDGKAFFQWRGLQKVEVDHDVWIGHGAVVLAGVRIGRGAVVGAGSVVTRDVPPYRASGPTSPPWSTSSW